MKIIKKVVLTLSLIFIGLVTSVHANEITLDINGLRIVKPAPNDDNNLRAFNWNPGVAIGMLVKSSQKQIVAIDNSKSVVNSIIDDTGKNLGTSKDKDYNQKVMINFFSHNLTENKLATTFEIEAKKIPAGNAKTITLDGELVVRVVNGQEDFPVKAVKLAPESIVDAGKVKFTIKSAKMEKNWNNEEKFNLSLEANQSLDDVAEVKFKDSQGALIKSTRRHWSSTDFLGKTIVNWNYELDKKVDIADIIISYWTGREDIKVPLKQTIGLGL